MRSFAIFLSILALCQARPRPWSNGALRPSILKGGEQYVEGGTDAFPGEFPWQLSVQRLSPTWSHSFGASLLSANYGLTAAHAIAGTLVSNVRVVAGLHQLSDLTGTQAVSISSYTLHEEFGVGLQTYSNDIAILNFATSITIGGNVQPAALPADNSNNYFGDTCVITGWGGLDASDRGVLQKASIQVISTTQCSNYMLGIPGGGTITDSQICVYDPDQIVGTCAGDNGGPLNCPDGDVTVVAGVGSWIISDGLDSCQLPFPSVYTRVGSYLGWIAANTP